MFTKNTLIGGSVTSCHITNNDTGLYDVTKMNKLVQRSSGSRSMENLLHMKMRQVVVMKRCMFYDPYIESNKWQNHHELLNENMLWMASWGGIPLSISNFYFASCPFNSCMLATSAKSLNSLPLDLNNVITANSF